MEYIMLYFYKLKHESVEKFLEISAETREKYILYGGEAEEIYKLAGTPKNYGLNFITSELKVEENEELWLGIVKFNSEEHARQVMQEFDKDKKVNELYEEFITYVTPLNKISFGEFEKEDY
jgi:hypothetical protein